MPKSLAFLPFLFLIGACADKQPAIALPPIERAEPVPIPSPPVGEADCEGVPCLSDRQAGAWMADVMAGFREANARLVWLKQWIATTK